MHRANLLALALAGAVLASPFAGASTPGAPPVTREGSFMLGPSGQADASMHVYFADFNLPVSAGDTLEVNWSANAGEGPAINFDIHSHGGPSQTLNYYTATAKFLKMEWKVPETMENASSVMISFTNPSIAPINLTYRFVLTAPPADSGPALFLLVAAVGAVAVVAFLYVRAAQKRAAKRHGRRSAPARHRSAR